MASSLPANDVVTPREICAEWITGRVVALTGASSARGRELACTIAKCQPKALLLLDQNSASLFDLQQELEYNRSPVHALLVNFRDQERITEVFGEYQPAVVCHTALLGDVRLIENQPGEAIKSNIFGTKLVAEAALASGCELFVFVAPKAPAPGGVVANTLEVAEFLLHSIFASRLVVLDSPESNSDAKVPSVKRGFSALDHDLLGQLRVGADRLSPEKLKLLLSELCGGELA